jgi:hypothetical protein
MRRPAVIALVTALAVAALAAATAQARGTADVSPIAGMSKAVTAAGTYRVRMTMTMRSDSLPEPLVIEAEGEARANPTILRMTLDLSSIMRSAGQPAAMGKFVMVESVDRTGLTIYMRGGPLAKMLAKGRTWAKLDASFYKQLTGVDIGKSLSAGADPSAQLSLFEKIGVTVDEVGTEKLGDAMTTEYHVVAPVAKLFSAQGYTPAEVKKLRAALQPGQTTVAYDVWLDAKGFPRRFLMSMPVMSGSTLVEEEIDMRLFSPGTIVSATLPPDRLVQDITQTLIDEVHPRA